MHVSRCIVPVIFFFCCFIHNTNGKFKILALMPYNGKSHFYFAEVLFEELARRGNDVTVLSHYPKKTPFPNYHDISIAGNVSDGIHSKNIEDPRPQLLSMMGKYNILRKAEEEFKTKKKYKFSIAS